MGKQREVSEIEKERKKYKEKHWKERKIRLKH
jgi:hypothetical protein